MDQVDPVVQPLPTGKVDERTARAALHRRRIVDYALRRRGVLAELRDGGLTIAEVCDADVYLLRAATFHGHLTETTCPVCRKEPLSNVSWVFGDDLGGASGSARNADDIEELALRHDAFTVHVVEVCRSCAWNHLVRSYEVGLSEGAGRELRRGFTRGQ